METGLKKDDHVDEEEEYVLLDLDSVYGHFNIRPNAPYVLSGLDTLNPVLIIDDKFKLIGEYEETVGTCFVFTEENVTSVNEAAGPSEANLSKGACTVDPNNNLSKEVKPIARLHKVLKFSFLADDDERTINDELTVETFEQE